MLTAVFHFEVLGLWVAGELQGTRHETSFEGYKLALVFPDGPGAFGTDQIKDTSFPTVSGYTTRQSDDALLAIEVRMLRVELGIDRTLPDGKAAGEQSERLTAAIELMRVMAEVARRFMKGYLDLVRSTENQYWLGSSASEPVITWISSLSDDGEPVPAGYLDPFHVSFQSAESALTLTRHAELVELATAGTKPGLPEKFLNDARFAARQPRPDLRQAVLLAAIACEVKVKQVLFAVASTAQETILNLLLENPRDWSVGAAALFDKAMRATCGRSLREEDRSLYKDIELLYQNRNKIAHRGGVGLSGDDVLKEHVTSAAKVFVWLDSVLAESSSNP